MKKLVAASLTIALAVMPTLASAAWHDNGADQWDKKYFKTGSARGEYGSRQVDVDGQACTPKYVTAMGVLAYASLVAGIVLPAVIPAAHAGGYHTVNTSVTKIVMEKTVTTMGPSIALPITHNAGSAAAWWLIGPAAFVTGSGLAAGLEYSEAFAKCMVSRGYSLTPPATAEVHPPKINPSTGLPHAVPSYTVSK